MQFGPPVKTQKINAAQYFLPLSCTGAYQSMALYGKGIQMQPLKLYSSLSPW
jgi:hypothetical protein